MEYFALALYRCIACGLHQEPSEFGTCTKCSEALEPLPEFVFDTDLSVLTQGAEPLPVHRVLAGYARANNISFSLSGSRFEPEQVFQPEVILPFIALEAMRLWQKIGRAHVRTPVTNAQL